MKKIVITVEIEDDATEEQVCSMFDKVASEINTYNREEDVGLAFGSDAGWVDISFEG